MRFRALWILVIALVAGAVLVAVTAQGSSAPGVTAPNDDENLQQGPPPPGPPGGIREIERLAFDLGLTSDQMQKIKALRDQERTAAQSYDEQMRQARDSIRSAIEAAMFDEDAVRALAVGEAKVMVELTVIHARTESAIYQLLTAEQRGRLSQLQAAPPPGRGR